MGFVYGGLLEGARTNAKGTMTKSQLEVAVGRGLAFCAHPVIAWRVLPPMKRAMVAGAYFAAAYVAVLAGLLVF